MPCIMELAGAKRALREGAQRLEQVEARPTGVVMPSIDELHLEPPEIASDGRCPGCGCKPVRPIQMMRPTIHKELEPHRGTEKQSEDLVQEPAGPTLRTTGSCGSPTSLAKACLHELVNDGLQNKLLHIPQEARTCLPGKRWSGIINEGCTGPDPMYPDLRRI